MNLESYLKLPAPQMRMLKSLYKKQQPLTILDVGACEGEDSIRYQKAFPKAKVFAFEPLPKNIQIVKNNLEKYDSKNIVLVEKGLSDKKGQSTFYVSSGRPEGIPDEEEWDYGNKSSSLLPPDKTKEVHKWLKFDQKIEIDTTTLESFMKENNLETIDFIHMDIQGAELLALRGAAKKIEKIKSIWMEVEATTLYKDQPLKQEMEDFMEKHNFYKVMDTVDDVAGDQFYLNKRYFDNPPNLGLWQKMLGRF